MTSINVRRIDQTNATVLTLGDTEILISYRTPVAAFVPGRGYIRTMYSPSVTTSRHINKWLRGATSTFVPQSEINALMGA